MKKKTNISELSNIGELFGLTLKYPPFDEEHDEFFFEIHDFKERPEFQRFIKMIKDLGIYYEYATKKKPKKSKYPKPIFLVINRSELNRY